MNPPASRDRRLARRSSLAVLVFLALIAPTGASAMVSPPRYGALSPTLALLSKPSVRSQSRGRQAEILGVAASGPGSLQRQAGRVLVNARFDRGAIARLPALRRAGARVLGASRGRQIATLAVRPASLRELAAVRGVAAITPSRTPMLFAVDCEGGSVISEGVAQINAKAAREGFAVDGAGTTVGVLSDSYDQATEAADGSGPVATKAGDDVATADLPGTAGECVGQTTPVDVLEDFESFEATDEGRAMAQIVHDVAPGASLAFATAFQSEESFAENIEALARPVIEGGAGAEVIVDDVGYFEEPFFQDGPVAAAVDQVTSEGVTYLSSAGNDNLFDSEGHEIASWEAPAYRSSGSCPGAVRELAQLNPTACMDFDPGPGVDRAFGIKVEAGATLTADLQWAEPWNGVGTDLDAILLDAGGEVLTGSAEDNSLTQRPVEIVQWENESGSEATVQLVVNRFSGASPRLKIALAQNGSGVSATEYPTSGGGDVVGPSVYGHAGAASAIAVGAVRFNNSSMPEEYSSRGPTTHYFGAVEGIAPAPELPSAEVISKPDVTATDCGATTFFAHRVSLAAPWRFCGTSAAAPHAAGAVALMREAAPLASPALLRSSLVGTASPFENFDACAVGGGLVESLGALEAAREEIIAGEPEPCLVPDASGPVVPAPGDWGVEEPPSPPSGEGGTTVVPILGPPPPTTFFKRHPPRTVSTAQRNAPVVFRFGSDQAGVVFLCAVDRGSFHDCGVRFARHFALGQHQLRVRARNTSGTLDPSPASFRFRVIRIR